MNLRLFLDANILFTAAYSPEGLSALLFELRRRGIPIGLLTSEHAGGEARVNLQLKQPDALGRLERLLKLLEVVHTPAKSPIALSVPEDDLSIFGAALAAGATHFITGDRKHFGRYFDQPAHTAGICIQTVRQFFDDRF